MPQLDVSFFGRDDGLGDLAIAARRTLHGLEFDPGQHTRSLNVAGLYRQQEAAVDGDRIATIRWN